jgi:PadR family transcriptional regulator PadR
MIVSMYTPYADATNMEGTMTEMLKGTLEGIVYALLVRIEQRRLVDAEKIPSKKGPPRKVYSLNDQGQEYLEEFWRTWSFLAERLEQLHEGGR